ncbi:uncharacterized protein L203_105521 [Cryptococcus depauperatus CBS 7841]|uniref:Uncharacterized protein n=1 Tax=Cryptococcus depauperatus CBS 7841 TaxID=1295531 RepID=A0A1E3IDB8_9TREE|nr:hypothetical protein L203_04200 [Cryptococcus depauperatus CBS 7841]ODN98742.1 hypothetical protein L204_02706 [Cryptococcus depauperatus CBS 7855]
MSTTGYTIHVAGLAPETTEDKLHDFFSFCGKLTSVKKTGTTADITFEKMSAMRTSLMLNGGTLDGAHLEVTSALDGEKSPSVLPTSATGSSPIGTGIGADGPLGQEDKPKAAIVAEYLAHGYVLGDHIIQKAIDVDNKQGISSRFLNFFNSLDSTVGNKVVGENQTVSAKLQEHAAAAVAKTKEVDQSRGISAKFHDYYSKVFGTPIGQKVIKFYTSTQKQVLDVHEEAMRIAEEKKRTGPTTVPADEPGSSLPSADVKADIASSTTPSVAAASVDPAAGVAAVPPPSKV